MFELIALRILILSVFGAAGFALRPMHASAAVATAGGLAFGLIVIAAELRIERLPLTKILGAAIGAGLGILMAAAGSLVLARTGFQDPGTEHFSQLVLLLVLAYIGLAVGAQKGEMLNLSAIGIFGKDVTVQNSYKILDTSVIIDGRIADIADTGFLDGILVIPQFVLRELQLVADSSDSMKRNRGRRGLDVLQRIQKMAHANVQIVEEDFPEVREVDLKLIELAKVYEGKIVTNDFNLNKVAQLRGVDVLNINELANALKPIVLPGETMRVFILKEGKEYNQGVAYLDDGTMVVVDNAKRMISKTIDVTVTSVLQTTAGKMIFGKHDERAPALTAERRKDQAVGEA